MEETKEEERELMSRVFGGDGPIERLSVRVQVGGLKKGGVWSAVSVADIHDKQLELMGLKAVTEEFLEQFINELLNFLKNPNAILQTRGLPFELEHKLQSQIPWTQAASLLTGSLNLQLPKFPLPLINVSPLPESDAAADVIASDSESVVVNDL